MKKDYAINGENGCGDRADTINLDYEKICDLLLNAYTSYEDIGRYKVWRVLVLNNMADYVNAYQQMKLVHQMLVDIQFLRHVAPDSYRINGNFKLG